MSEHDQTRTTRQTPAALPTRRKGRPHYILGTLWLIFGLICLVVAFTSHTAGAQNGFWAGPLLIAYAIYLYRGGRWVIFFF